MPWDKHRYGAAHRRSRSELLATNKRDNGGLCNHCWSDVATVADHQPPLKSYADPRNWEGILVPSCARCSNRQGGRLAGRDYRPDRRTRNWIPT